MAENRSTIFKFVGVRTDRLRDLDVTLMSPEIREERTFGERLDGFGQYAIIKSVNWSQDHGTMTVEVEVFEFQRWCKNPRAGQNDRHYVFNEKRPTPRHVIEVILDALNRYQP